MNIDEKLLDRIKVDVIKHHYHPGDLLNFDLMRNEVQATLWPEVCYRYSQEYMDSIKTWQESIIISELKDEISQLKKQLEDRELKCPKNKPEYISCGLLFEEVRERDVKIEDLLKVIEIQKQKLLHYAVNVCPEQDAEIQRRDNQIEELKYKLEVKEKPDFESIANTLYVRPVQSNLGKNLNIVHGGRENYIKGCEQTWNEHVIPRDAAIAEMDKELKEAKELLSEIDRSLYIGPDLKDKEIMKFYTEVVQRIKDGINDFLNHRQTQS